jgi:3-oxoacyl-[acyl-carrier protein] reductase
MQGSIESKGALLENRVALVTGAGRGIGRAIAIALVKNGASVAITDLQLGSAQEVAKLIEGISLRAKAYKMDVSKKKEVDKIFEQVCNELGRLDILVNNAGVSRAVHFEEITETEWDRVIDTNLKGTFLCSQAGFRIMGSNGGGSIIMISGGAGRSGGMVFPGHYNYYAHYCASKAGIEALTKSLAFEGAAYGIRVNAVSPGPIKTDLVEKIYSPEQLRKVSSAVPLGRLGLPEEVADAVIFLASDRADYVTAKVLDVNGGLLR